MPTQNTPPVSDSVSGNLIGLSEIARMANTTEKNINNWIERFDTESPLRPPRIGEIQPESPLRKFPPPESRPPEERLWNLGKIKNGWPIRKKNAQQR